MALVDSVISAEDVLADLLFDPTLIPKDVDNVLRRCTDPLHSRIQGYRVLAIRENPRVQAWLSLDESSLLLVNGNAATPLDLSTSFISAKMVHALLGEASRPRRKNLEIITLAYFCGQHQDFHRDEAARPSELAMSLLLQLVDQHRDFDEADLQRCLDRTELEPHSVGSVVSSLGRLVGLLPSRTIVYLVLDGIDHYAQPDLRRHEFQEVLALLIEEFNAHKRAKFKMIFTCAQKSVMLEDMGLLADDEIVNVPLMTSNSQLPISMWNH